MTKLTDIISAVGAIKAGHPFPQWQPECLHVLEKGEDHGAILAVHACQFFSEPPQLHHAFLHPTGRQAYQGHGIMFNGFIFRWYGKGFEFSADGLRVK